MNLKRRFDDTLGSMAGLGPIGEQGRMHKARTRMALR